MESEKRIISMAEQQIVFPDGIKRLSIIPIYPNEKIVDFRDRVRKQLNIIDRYVETNLEYTHVTSKGYTNKIRRFLVIQYIENNKDKRVKDLVKFLRINISVDEELSKISSELGKGFCNLKIIMLNSYYPLPDGKYPDFDFHHEMERIGDYFINYGNSILPKYVSEYILINKLIRLLNDKEFLKTWSVSAFEQHLYEWAQDYNFNVEFELDELFSHPFFNKKEYTSMNVRDFKNLVSNRAQILSRVIDFINSLIAEGNHFKADPFSCLDVGRDFDGAIEAYKCCINEFIGREKYPSNDFEYPLYKIGMEFIENGAFDVKFDVKV